MGERTWTQPGNRSHLHPENIARPLDQNQPHPVLQFLAPPRISLYQEVGYL
jgi:hypothetical protein